MPLKLRRKVTYRTIFGNLYVVNMCYLSDHFKSSWWKFYKQKLSVNMKSRQCSLKYTRKNPSTWPSLKNFSRTAYRISWFSWIVSLHPLSVTHMSSYDVALCQTHDKLKNSRDLWTTLFEVISSWLPHRINWVLFPFLFSWVRLNYCAWRVGVASPEADVRVTGLWRVLNCNWNTGERYSSSFCTGTTCTTLQAGLLLRKLHVLMMQHVRQCTRSRSKTNCNAFR